MNCAFCKSKIELVDHNGWPQYYFGAGPNNPQDAKDYFCWAGCAREHQKQQNG